MLKKFKNSKISEKSVKISEGPSPSPQNHKDQAQTLLFGPNQTQAQARVCSQP
jgi:hypothetical protein